VREGKQTKVAVIGASGYAGEELIRLLLKHPSADLVAVTSRQSAGKTLREVFPRFGHDAKAETLKFTNPDAGEIGGLADFIFLALPHGVSAEIGARLVRNGKRVLDLSADFRIRNPKTYAEFYGKEHPEADLLELAVYGLPEIHREKIRRAQLVACPGCYPTSILLPVLPLLRAKVIDPARIMVTSLSGVTGAGRKVEADYLFAECNESMRPYGVPKHRHLGEIEQELSAAAGEKIIVQFTPHLVPVNRGIISTIYADIVESADAAAISAIFERAYKEEPFVRLLSDARLPDTKNVVQANFIEIGWRVDPRTKRLIVMSAIDNLTKGTSGQAVQCFNLMCGEDETAGLM
jgi:N-acetyl-gamma-glutamyl-phosphate reductase